MPVKHFPILLIIFCYFYPLYTHIYIHRVSQLNISELLRVVGCIRWLEILQQCRFWCSRWLGVKVSCFRAGNCHFAQRYQVSWKADYTNAELVDMRLAYGAANYSGPATHSYAEWYLMKCIPSHNFHASLHQKLAERSSFKRDGMEQARIA